MTNSTISLLPRLLVCILFPFAMLLSAIASPLEGIWVNTNPETNSVPQVEIQIDANGEARFTWWGKTRPINSKYGPLDLKLYGKSVGDHQPATNGTSTHENFFSKSLFTMTMDGGYLKVLQFTEFKDDSGRKPYCLNLTFKKE